LTVNRGVLVALEGLDGCGKSTQLPHLAAALAALGHDVVATREPSDGPIGQRIRAMARSGEPVAPAEELRWFQDDRREHVARVIGPALAAGRWVLTDRYFLSTVAYQGARGLDWREILAASEAEFPVPDAALIFELTVADGLARARGRGGHRRPGLRASRLSRARRGDLRRDRAPLPRARRRVGRRGRRDRPCARRAARAQPAR
jgi:dTMP kinase